MTKKSFVVILILSVIVWYISRYIVALFGVFILKNFNATFYESGCSPTGYPLFYCVDNNLSLILVSFINIAFLFLIIWKVWKILPKLFKRK